MTAPPFGGGFSPGLRRYTDEPIQRLDWLASEHFSVKRAGATLDHLLVPLNADGRRLIKGGTSLGKVTLTEKYGPYLAQTSEVQTVAITGSPTAGSFTLTFAGQTTAPIAWNATAAAVQAALEGLSNINPGDVTVTGGPLPGTAVVVTFKGRYLGTDVATMTDTSSLTGGTTPDAGVTVTTAGGADPAGLDGREVGVGLLFPGDLDVTQGDAIIGVLTHGSALEARCTNVDSAFKQDVLGRIWFQ